MAALECSSFSTYASALKECGKMKSLHEGNRVHTHMIMEGFDQNLVLANHIIDLYSKCGSIVEARHMFDRMPDRNVFSWMAILSAYSDEGLADEVLALYGRMGSVVPDKFVFATVLKACTTLIALESGRNAHIQMMKFGTEMDVFVQTALIDMYIRCRSITDAWYVFRASMERNTVLWNAMIIGHAQQGYLEEAMVLIEAMQEDGILPDKVTFVGRLQVCAGMNLLEEALHYHKELVMLDYEADTSVSNTLLDAYTKCRSLEDARGVFDSMASRDVVSYNIMIASYAQHGFSEEATIMYQRMKQDGIKPNETTFVGIIKACILLEDAERGAYFHQEALRQGCELNPYLASALIHMYAKCGKLEQAYEVFWVTEDRNVVVWTAMITGCVQQGLGEESLDLYQRMEEYGVKPNEATIIGVLKGCSMLGAAEMGLRIHGDVRNSILKDNVMVMNGLMEMHASCGNMKKAHIIFSEINRRDAVSWTVMIGGYAQKGCVEEALRLFKHMMQESVKPTAVTFVCILCACSHGGLIDAGCGFFYSMVWEHGMMPTPDHWACMVDLLGRAGCLEETLSVVVNAQVESSELVWRTFLGACRTANNKRLADCGVEQLLCLNPDSDAAYVLVSNIQNERLD